MTSESALLIRRFSLELDWNQKKKSRSVHLYFKLETQSDAFRDCNPLGRGWEGNVTLSGGGED